MNALIIFCCSFLLVLCLSLQQLNVEGRYRVAAFVTSLMIASCNLFLLKLVPQPTSWWENIAYVISAGFGVLVAMDIHPRMKNWVLARRRQSRWRQFFRMSREERKACFRTGRWPGGDNAG